MRKSLLAGNWKMNLDLNASVELASAIAKVDFGEDREVMLAPNFTALHAVSEALKGSKVQLGAQNFCAEASGAFTGEISGDMLKSVGVSHIILGHSERRTIYAETDQMINSKVKSAIEQGFVAVLCVGETLEEREEGKAVDVVKEQTIQGLSSLSEKDLDKVVIAYEPVWAIGTGKTASPEDADEMHNSIRKTIADIYGESAADKLRILYGGSVKDSNVDELMKKTNIDGGLVGGASMKPESFSRIIQYQG